MVAVRLSICISFVIPLLATAETRVFVSQTGTTLEGEVLGADATSVKLRKLSDNVEMTVPLASLCQEDKNYLGMWMKRSLGTEAAVPGTGAVPPVGSAGTNAAAGAPLSLKGRVQTKKRGTANVDIYDRRKVRVQLDVEIESREFKRSLSGGQAYFAVLTKNVADTKDLSVALVERFPVELGPMAKVTHTTPEIRLEYDEESSYRYGYKYQGHVLVVQDAGGKTVLVETSQLDYVKVAERILKLQQGQSINKDLEAVTQVVR